MESTRKYYSTFPTGVQSGRRGVPWACHPGLSSVWYGKRIKIPESRNQSPFGTSCSRQRPRHVRRYSEYPLTLERRVAVIFEAPSVSFTQSSATACSRLTTGERSKIKP